MGEADYFVARCAPASSGADPMPADVGLRVVVPDLRGYGASEAPPGGPHGEGYTKREMAGEFAELMAELGHERFAVVGHDRGARVAYRLALDHPERISRKRKCRRMAHARSSSAVTFALRHSSYR